MEMKNPKGMRVPHLVIWIQRSPDEVLCFTKTKFALCGVHKMRREMKTWPNDHWNPEISRCSVVPEKKTKCVQ